MGIESSPPPPEVTPPMKLATIPVRNTAMAITILINYLGFRNS